MKGLLCISNDELAQELIATVAVAQSSDVKHSLTITAQVLSECQPSDLHEVRLCLQAHILFTQGMHYMELAKRGSVTPQCEFYMKSALKLIRLHNETLESISRYKQQGEQKVIVQHVHVERGGQAIVGTIEAGGGGMKKNERGTS